MNPETASTPPLPPPSGAASASVALSRAVVKTVTFHNPDNGYSVLKLLDGGTGKAFTAIGCFPRFTPGETLELIGEWTRHPAFGPQFKCSGYRILPPDSLEAMEKYLASGLFKGV